MTAHSSRSLARDLRRLAGAAMIVLPVLVAGPARAQDFVAKCQEFATAANDGKPAENADKICECIKGKMSDSEQTASLSVLHDIVEAGKVGKEPAEPSGDKKAALQKFMDSGDTCSGQGDKK